MEMLVEKEILIEWRDREKPERREPARGFSDDDWLW